MAFGDAKDPKRRNDVSGIDSASRHWNQAAFDGCKEGSECGRMVGLRNLRTLSPATMKEELTSCTLATDRSVACKYCTTRHRRIVRLWVVTPAWPVRRGTNHIFGLKAWPAINRVGGRNRETPEAWRMAAGLIQLWRDPASGSRRVIYQSRVTRRIATQVISVRRMSSRFSDLARNGAVLAAKILCGYLAPGPPSEALMRNGSGRAKLAGRPIFRRQR